MKNDSVLQAVSSVRGLPEGHSAGGKVRLPKGELLQAVGEEGEVLPGARQIRPRSQVLQAGHAVPQGVQSQVQVLVEC